MPNDIRAIIFSGFRYGKLPEAVQELLRLIRKKDRQTYQHSIRVGLLSRQIGQLLGMIGRELEELYHAALLHDVGKVTIPDDILTKPSRLNQQEKEVMAFHPLGTKVYLNISSMEKIATIAYLHHEHYDGNGYPLGLKGSEIPLQSRIILIADTFDAMISKRCYRNGVDFNLVIDEFVRHKGSQFDPQITELFLKFITGSSCKKELASSYSRCELEQSYNHLT